MGGQEIAVVHRRATASICTANRAPEVAVAFGVASAGALAISGANGEDPGVFAILVRRTSTGTVDAFGQWRKRVDAVLIAAAFALPRLGIAMDLAEERLPKISALFGVGAWIYAGLIDAFHFV